MAFASLVAAAPELEVAKGPGGGCEVNPTLLVEGGMLPGVHPS